jgi:ABC-type dipeptide/oligopeptide/nickel transport system permease subunit
MRIATMKIIGIVLGGISLFRQGTADNFLTWWALRMGRSPCLLVVSLIG